MFIGGRVINIKIVNLGQFFLYEPQKTHFSRIFPSYLFFFAFFQPPPRRVLDRFLLIFKEGVNPQRQCGLTCREKICVFEHFSFLSFCQKNYSWPLFKLLFPALRHMELSRFLHWDVSTCRDVSLIESFPPFVWRFPCCVVSTTQRRFPHQKCVFVVFCQIKQIGTCIKNFYGFEILGL